MGPVLPAVRSWPSCIEAGEMSPRLTPEAAAVCNAAPEVSAARHPND